MVKKLKQFTAAVFGLSSLVMLATFIFIPKSEAAKPWELTPEQLAQLTPENRRVYHKTVPLQKRLDALVANHGSDPRAAAKPEVLNTYREIADEAWRVYKEEPCTASNGIAGNCTCTYIEALYFSDKREDAVKELVALQSRNPSARPVHEFFGLKVAAINDEFWSAPTKGISATAEAEYTFIIEKAEQIAKQDPAREFRLGYFVYNARVEFSKVLFASGKKAEAIAQLKLAVAWSPREANTLAMNKLVAHFKALENADFAQAYKEAGGDPNSSKMQEAKVFVQTARLGPGERFGNFKLVEQSDFR